MGSVQFRGLTPYLYYEDAAAMLDWLSRVFGFEETSRYVDTNGVVREAEMLVGSTELWMSGQDPGYWERKGRGPEQLILVWVDDVDAQYEHIRAAGVEVEPPADQTYDVRTMTVADPEGYEWNFLKRLGTGYQPTEPDALREVRR